MESFVGLDLSDFCAKSERHRTYINGDMAFGALENVGNLGGFWPFWHGSRCLIDLKIEIQVDLEELYLKCAIYFLVSLLDFYI